MSRCYPFPPPNLPRTGWGGGAPAKPIELLNCLDAGKPEPKKVKRGSHEKKEEEKTKRTKLNGGHLEDETQPTSCVTEDKEHQSSANIFRADITQGAKAQIENSSTVKCNGKTLRIWFAHKKTEPGNDSGSGRIIHELDNVGTAGKQRTELALPKEPANIVTANKKPGYPPPLPSKRNIPVNKEVTKQIAENRVAQKIESETANRINASKKPGYPPPLPPKSIMHDSITPKQELPKMTENRVVKKIEPETANRINPSKKPGYPPPRPPKRIKHDNIPPKQEVPKMVENRAVLDSKRAMPAMVENISTGSQGRTNSAQFTASQHGRVKRVEAQPPSIPRTVSLVPEKNSQMRNTAEKATTSAEQRSTTISHVPKKDSQMGNTGEKPPTIVEQKLNLSRESAEATALPEIKACSTSQTGLDASALKKKQKALKKLERKKKKMRRRAAQYKALMENWNPLPLCPLLVDEDDSEDWLFGCKQKSAPKAQPSLDGGVSAAVIPDSFRDLKTLLPRACYLPEAGIYALPYSIPF